MGWSYRPIRRLPKLLAGMITAFIVVFGLVATATPASARTVLCSSPNYGFNCVSFSGYRGQSTWGYPVDSRGHNCTNYAAYRLAQNGADNPGNLGNAYAWDDNARSKGFPVNGTPAVGAIAQWNDGAGHVAYVEAVTNDYVEVTDDNWGGTTTRVRYHRGHSDWPHNFIHIKDVASQPAPPKWGGVGNATFIGTDTMAVGKELRANQYMLSSNGLFVLMMQSDGNLVMFRSTGVIWASNTAGNPGAYLRVQDDGNVVIYKTRGGTALWSTGKKSIAKLVMQSDGNLVGRSSSGAAKWATNTVRHTYHYTSQGSQLEVGSSMPTYKFLRSPDKRYFALMQNDGNLVVYGPGYRILWTSGTSGNPDAYLQVQSDGNAVIYQTVHGRALWATGKKSIAKLVMQSDGNFIAYTASGQAVWATNTEGRL